MPADGSIRVLVVDDSAIVRKILTEAISGQPGLEVVGTAPDPYIARDKILELAPDVLTLDIEMPRMNGLTFLKKLMHFRPMPVIVISSLAQASCQTAMEALSLGAVEVLAKPGGPYSVGELRSELASKIRAAAASRVRRPASSAPAIPPPRLAATPWAPSTVIAIGASTGGTEAIAEVLPRMPPDAPGILITQHIPAGFSRAFATRLNQICAVEVKEAEDGDALYAGRALVAPGDRHMLLRHTNGGYSVVLKNGPRVCYQRPSVDVMFSSVAETAGARSVGVLLTGMGSDGAQGLLKMRQAGARTVAQDEATCVVFGMPREAIRMGAAGRVVALSGIPQAILTASSVQSGRAG
ncbi:MAG: chemotaxis response regulator protein-glutamate methylesterase [Bryobacteraceae bacterium]|jgi:two-component system chemotaxis response regulator CheB